MEVWTGFELDWIELKIGTTLSYRKVRNVLPNKDYEKIRKVFGTADFLSPRMYVSLRCSRTIKPYTT